MFRRKDESLNDPSASDVSVSGAPSTETHGETASAGSSSSSQQASLNIGSSASASSYMPSSSARSSSETSRNAAPMSYRPTPIAEFNRGASRATPESLRSPASPAAAFGASAEKSASGNKANRRVLTVGNDILLKGEIATCDRLVIEGRVEAKLSEVHTVEIAEVGSFKGTAEVEDAEISGVFEGDLIVRNRLVIYASGEVRGNISYGEIEIERGGRLTGQIKTGSMGAAGAKPKMFDTADKRKEAVA